MFYRFGRFALCLESYLLTFEGQEITIQPKLMDLLAYLIQRAGKLVTKEELLEQVWDNGFVTESALSQAIKKLRRVLEMDEASSWELKTVYGRGFRLTGSVDSEERCPDADWDPPKDDGGCTDSQESPMPAIPFWASGENVSWSMPSTWF